MIDTRAPGAPRVHALHGVEADVYEICGDTYRTPEQVAATLAERDVALSPEELEVLLRRFCDAGIAVAEDRRFLSLGLPRRAV
jgi:hypothetical protein